VYVVIFSLQSCASIFNEKSQSVIVAAAENKENVMVMIVTPSESYNSKLPLTIITTPSNQNYNSG
jgi:hypothetical protein